MFTPNHVIISSTSIILAAPISEYFSVLSGRNLVVRGRNGKNDAFAIISCGDTRFQTAIKQRALNPFWDESFEFYVPKLIRGVIWITVYHRTMLGMDEFLGQTCLCLEDVYDPEASSVKPRKRWYPLKGKSGKRDEHKYRGEVELSLEFVCKPPGLVKTPASPPKEKKQPAKDLIKAVFLGRKGNNSGFGSTPDLRGLAAPAPDEDWRTRTLPASASLGFKGSHPSLPALPEDSEMGDVPRFQINQQSDSDSSSEHKLGSAGRHRRTSVSPQGHFPVAQKVAIKGKDSLSDGTLFGPKPTPLQLVNLDLVYETLAKQDLIQIVKEQRKEISRQDREIRDLEDYIDHLLARVMEKHPELLEGPLSARHRASLRFSQRLNKN